MKTPMIFTKQPVMWISPAHGYVACNKHIPNVHGLAKLGLKDMSIWMQNDTDSESYVICMST